MQRPESGRQGVRSRREDGALLLPFFGTVALLPPALNLFVRGELTFGVPLILSYLFAVWVALILGAVLLSRSASFRLEPVGEEQSDAPE